MRYLRTLASSFGFLALALPSSAQAVWQMAYPPTTPQARYGGTFAAHEASGACLLLFGWDTNTGVPRNDAWKFEGNAWLPVSGLQPPWRTKGMVAFDAARGEVVLFGGYDGNNLRDDTWRWNGNQWSVANVVIRPAPRQNAAMAYDPQRQVIVLFGGRLAGAPGIIASDTWEWNGTAWQQRSPVSSPREREFAQLAFDPVGGGVLLHGGLAPGPGGLGTVLNDTWTYGGSTWSQRQPATPPPYRFDFSMVTDHYRERVVLLGGSYGDAFTWEWNGGQWHVVYQPTPAPRYGFGMGYDGALRRLVVHAGVIGTVGGGIFLNDTWTYATSLPAEAQPFGSGCSGSAGVPVLANAPYSLPWLGDTMRTRVSNIAQNALGALFVTSFTPSFLPMSLAPFGAPGCDLYMQPEFVDLRTAAGSVVDFALTIPSTPSLVGVVVFQQALPHDPTANPLGLTTTNGLRMVLGIR